MRRATVLLKPLAAVTTSVSVMRRLRTATSDQSRFFCTAISPAADQMLRFTEWLKYMDAPL